MTELEHTTTLQSITSKNWHKKW